MQKIDKDTFLRSFKVLSNQSFDLFLGAGASISSGIHSGSDLVWLFKRELLSVSGKINGKKFQDLKVEANKRILQSYFDEKGESGITNPYSHYFNECYPDPIVRKEFLTELVRDKKPSIGFLCLAALIEQLKFNVVWTTNFDDLIENEPVYITHRNKIKYVILPTEEYEKLTHKKMEDEEIQMTQRGLQAVKKLRGLGKEIWKDVDPDKYVEELRSEWD